FVASCGGGGNGDDAVPGGPSETGSGAGPTTGAGTPGPDALDPSAAGPGAGDAETEESPESAGSSDAFAGLAYEDLVARMKAIPDELAPTLDPELLEDTDPREFPAASHIGGTPVRIVREFHPTQGTLLRIATVRSEVTGTHALLHGPEWIYHPTGGLRTTTWWRDDVKHGPITRYRPVGTITFEARFQDGQLEGLRREYTKNEVLVKKALYRGGVLQGPYRVWYPKGQLAEQATYEGGQLDGQRRRWAPNGVLMLDERYVVGRREGKYTEYNEETGEPKRWGAFDGGLRTGRWSETDPAGRLTTVAEYERDLRNGVFQLWDPKTGNLVESSTFEKGVQSGPSRTWFADGVPQSEGAYVDGRRTGPWKYWRADGTLNDSWAGVYEDDERVGPLADAQGPGEAAATADGR
ncbi:MAG: hypothetical protein AAFP86_19805, partial [Planctomycetota bacterium]